MSALWGQGRRDSAVNVPLSPLPLRIESREKMDVGLRSSGIPVHRGGEITPSSAASSDPSNNAYRSSVA